MLLTTSAGGRRGAQESPGLVCSPEELVQHLLVRWPHFTNEQAGGLEEVMGLRTAASLRQNPLETCGLKRDAVS